MTRIGLKRIEYDYIDYHQYRPTPDECLSPFWTKQFPGCGDDASKDGPGGEKKASSPSTAGSGKKKSPVTLNLAGNRIFVINNGRVVEDGSSLGRMKSSAASATAKEDNTGLVSTYTDQRSHKMIWTTSDSWLLSQLQCKSVSHIL